MSSEINTLKQPAPNIVGNTTKTDNKKQTIVYNRPQLGVLQVPNISRTPVSDILEVKKQENPKMAYKIPKKPNPGFKLQNILSSGILLCGLTALLQIIHKKTPPKK